MFSLSVAVREPVPCIPAVAVRVHTFIKRVFTLNRDRKLLLLALAVREPLKLAVKGMQETPVSLHQSVDFYLPRAVAVAAARHTATRLWMSSRARELTVVRVAAVAVALEQELAPVVLGSRVLVTAVGRERHLLVGVVVAVLALLGLMDQVLMVVQGAQAVQTL
jgi:hypothetical protein